MLEPKRDACKECVVNENEVNDDASDDYDDDDDENDEDDDNDGADEDDVVVFLLVCVRIVYPTTLRPNRITQEAHPPRNRESFTLHNRGLSEMAPQRTIHGFKN